MTEGLVVEWPPMEEGLVAAVEGFSLSPQQTVVKWW
jgi:hypothetical protein